MLSIDQQITFRATRDLFTIAHFDEDVLGLPLALIQGDRCIHRG